MPDSSSTSLSSIFVSISTSSTTLAKSGTPPFTITLNAHVENTSYDKPVTIDTFATLLKPDPSAALDYQGLTFIDTGTGKAAKRRVIDVQYQLAETLNATSSSVAEIPATEPYYSVSHTMHTSTPPREGSEVQLMIASASNQAEDLEVGRTYEIGLGSTMSTVAWWKIGTKEEVFAKGPLSRRAQGPKLQMVLVDTARFEVVE